MIYGFRNSESFNHSNIFEKIIANICLFPSKKEALVLRAYLRHHVILINL